MSIKYKILFVEDIPTDAELAIYETGKVLKSFEYRLVDNKKDFLEQLNNFCPDLIISDYQLPSFDGMAALKLSIEKDPILPVIILTGSMNEDTAVECMKAGATDYVIKEHIKRLGQAVIHALDEKEVRTRKKLAEEALVKSEEKYRTIFENVQDVFYQVSMEGKILEISPSIRYFIDFNREKLIGEPVSNIYYNYEDRIALLDAITKNGEVRDYELPLKTASGLLRYGSINARLVLNANGKPDHIDGSIRDITQRIKVENDLRQSEEKFRNLFENNAAANFIIDRTSLQIIDANLAASEYYGWSIEELKQMKVGDINTSDISVIKSAIESVSKMSIGHFEFKHRLKNGNIRDVEVFSSRISNSENDSIHTIVHDITDKKKTDERIRLLSKTIEQSPVVVLIADPNGTIEYVNSTFTRISGYSYDEVIGKNPRILNSGYHSTAFFEDLWKTVLSGKEWTGEIQNKKKNGEIYWENVSISPLVDEAGNITHLVGIKEDISEKRRMLEDLLIAKDKAETSDKLKTAFINNISHEVRTPLNGIIGFSEMLVSPDITSENKALFSDIIKKSSRRLLNTITSYMDISMIVSDNMEVHTKRFPINQILDDLFKEYVQIANDKGLNIKLTRPDIPANLQLETDPDLLHKTLGHLLDNAIKFTVEGDIEFGFRKTLSSIEFFVQDTGIGIDKEKADVIFENFMQADISLTRGYEGSGLGLSIAHGLARLLGGTISVESEKGQGTTILIQLPDSLIAKYSPQETLPRIQPVYQTDPVILVAEDDEFNYKFLEIILKKANFKVLRAENGVEAIENCRTHAEICLVLMDIKMPIMGGIEATKEIKALNPNLPVIALTAYVSTQDEYEALLSGCDEFISKPVNRVKLLELMNKLLVRS
ncbi:MAG: PAS domain S-box protein [Bacteroidales bacterium]|nr:PAS domain S-box protein [Bacteroidales bacterium]